MTRRYRYVHRVGVELEGGWDNRPSGAVEDGSVDVAANFSGEVPSPILRPSEVEQWVTDNYPHYTNGTCGLHVHVSFGMLQHYSRLMEPAFRQFFREQLYAWGEQAKIHRSSQFWPRLAGDAYYCRDEFIPSEQVAARNKGDADRYTQLNYCFGVHGTIECRVLPGFKYARVAVKAIYAVLDIFELYLRTTKLTKAQKCVTLNLTEGDFPPSEENWRLNYDEDPRSAEVELTERHSNAEDDYSQPVISSQTVEA